MANERTGSDIHEEDKVQQPNSEITQDSRAQRLNVPMPTLQEVNIVGGQSVVSLPSLAASRDASAQSYNRKTARINYSRSPYMNNMDHDNLEYDYNLVGISSAQAEMAHTIQSRINNTQNSSVRVMRMSMVGSTHDRWT